MRWTSAIVLLIPILEARAAIARELPASSAGELRAAIEGATAGDIITVAPGTYAFDSSIWTSSDGQPGQPITVRAARLGDVRIDFQSVEGIVINHAYWTIDSLWINAACPNPDNCEAAIGVKPSARGFLLFHARVTNWYQHVKAAREANAEVEDASIVGSEFYNDIARYSQVIDIVGGKRWRIAGNYVHDWNGSDNGAFGIFLKGDTSDGVIEQNLVVCTRDRPATAGAMVGISLGQGGTGDQYCPNGQCVCEDRGSIVRNNIVAHCSDAGLHALRACGGKFYNNTVFDTASGLQIQEDSPMMPVEIRNNLMSKRIFGGTNYVESNNLFMVDDSLFNEVYAGPDQENFGDGPDVSSAKDRGTVLGDVTSDYCGAPRDGSYDFGAIEFPASCLTWPWSADRIAVPPPPSDAGVIISDTDAGVSADAGTNADAGVNADASVNADARVNPGASMNREAPQVAAGITGSCSCDQSAHGGGDRSFAAGLLIALVVFRRTTRGRNGSRRALPRSIHG